MRVVNLHQQQFSPTEIGLLLQISQPLLTEYLALYDQHDSPFAGNDSKSN